MEKIKHDKYHFQKGDERKNIILCGSKFLDWVASEAPPDFLSGNIK
jgi:hypothetical protein